MKKYNTFSLLFSELPQLDKILITSYSRNVIGSNEETYWRTIALVCIGEYLSAETGEVFEDDVLVAVVWAATRTAATHSATFAGMSRRSYNQIPPISNHASNQYGYYLFN